MHPALRLFHCAIAAAGVVILASTVEARDALAPGGLSVTRPAESRVDGCVVIQGNWGTFINGKSYQQNPLDTFKGWQYATYYDQDRRLSVARRKLPAGAWEIIHFPDYVFKGDDNHNVTVLGVCPHDGTIHLAFDHHSDPLHYRISKPGVADEPERVKWAPDLFSDVRDWLKPGQKVGSVTYPRFARTPQGNLLLTFRDGIHYDGRLMFSEYDLAKAGWSERWQVISSQGRYVFGDRVSTSRSSYENGVHFDYQTGRLHMSWTWREEGALQHNVNYAWSEDNGRTWFNSEGKPIGGPKQSIGIDSPGIAIWEVSPARGIDNSEGQCVDALGQPHILVWHLRNGEPDLKPGERNEAKSAYYHYWRDARGKWHQNELPHPVDKSERNRPKIIATRDNDLVGMFNFQGNIVLCGATLKNEYRDWAVLRKEPGPWDGEPLPDPYRWRDEGVLSIYMQKESKQPRQPSDLFVLDFLVASGATGMEPK